MDQNPTLYLYGLSIQGIQSYIFETDKLKEIVGASEIVSSLAGDCISNLTKEDILTETDKEEIHVLQDAAGTYRCLAPEEIVKKLYQHLPKAIKAQAGDISFSQAVVEVGDDDSFSYEHIQQLEKQLQAARNIPYPTMLLGQMATFKVPRTGKPAVKVNHLNTGDDRYDLNQTHKRKLNKEYKYSLLPKLVNNEEEWECFTDDIEQLTSDSYNNWVAVVHADGNALGKKLLQLKKENLVGEQAKAFFTELSNKLDTATQEATKLAFEEVVKTALHNNIYPTRLVILGGDDLTFIIRGDLAVPFTEVFLRAFAARMKAHLAPLDDSYKLSEPLFAEGITACAGIAFIKSHYPFHYGVELAGSLCKAAKEAAKKISSDQPPSSLLFHRVHSSFVRSWPEIMKQELSTTKKEPEVNKSHSKEPELAASLVGGPYFIDQQADFLQIADVLKTASILSREGAPAGRIREWLGHLLQDPAKAKEDLKRIKEVIDKKQFAALGLKAIQESLDADLPILQIPHYDALTLLETKTY